MPKNRAGPVRAICPLFRDVSTLDFRRFPSASACHSNNGNEKRTDYARSSPGCNMQRPGDLKETPPRPSPARFSEPNRLAKWAVKARLRRHSRLVAASARQAFSQQRAPATKSADQVEPGRRCVVEGMSGSGSLAALSGPGPGAERHAELAELLQGKAGFVGCAEFVRRNGSPVGPRGQLPNTV
jgi:hypothetical protein